MVVVTIVDGDTFDGNTAGSVVRKIMKAAPTMDDPRHRDKTEYRMEVSEREQAMGKVRVPTCCDSHFLAGLAALGDLVIEDDEGMQYCAIPGGRTNG